MMRQTYGMGLLLVLALGCAPANSRSTPAAASTAQPSHPTSAVPMDPDLEARSELESSYSRGLGLAKRQRFAAAERIFDRVLKASPSHTAALRNRGACRAQLGRLDEAKRDLERVLSRNPRDAAALYNLGFVFLEKEEFNSAIEAYSQTLEHQPRLERAYVSRGIAFSKLGRTNEAIRDFSSAIKINPKLSEAYLLRAAAHRENLDVAKAQADMERADTKRAE
jgi:tetratricopeptide (TPR) repeat protein